MSTLRLNLVSNFAGAGWLAVIQVVFVPVYINLLGIEGYGLIGFYLTLQGVLRVLDFGLTPTVNRALARYSVLGGQADEARDFARTFEAIYWLIGMLVGLLVWMAAPMIAQRWIKPGSLPTGTLLSAVRSMGVLAALQWPLSFYQGGLLGLQRQSLLNVVKGGMSTLAAIAGVLVLWIVAPSVTLFFRAQIAVNAVHVVVMGWLLWRSLPATGARPRVAPKLFFGVYRFAAGMSGITLCSLILTQADKIVLSKLLSLELFGYYTLAGVLGNALAAVNAPIFNAIFPRFTALVAAGDDGTVARLFRLGSQWVAVVTVPTTIVIALFSLEIMSLWTGSVSTARNTAPLVSVLIIGSALNGLMNLPYALQLAHGWTGIGLRLNLFFVVTFVPALLLAAGRYGALGAAMAWTALNLIYVAVGVPATRRRLFGDFGLEWFTDLGAAAGAALGVVVVWRALAFQPLSTPSTVLVLLAALVTGTMAAAAVSPQVRKWSMGYVSSCLGRVA